MSKWRFSFNCDLIAKGRKSGLGKGVLLAYAIPARPGPFPSFHHPISAHTGTLLHSYVKRLLTLAFLSNGASLGPLLWSALTEPSLGQALVTVLALSLYLLQGCHADEHLIVCPV